MSRVLKNATNQITQGYNVLKHRGIDLVKYKGQTTDIIAHTEGTVVEVVKNYNRTDKKGNSYGNYVLIRHPNKYYTLYAHMKYGTVKVSKGQWIEKGQVIGYMGNTGYSQGAHLHFEVRNTLNVRINPTPYIDADLPKSDKKSITYRVGNGHWYDTVSNGATAGNGKTRIDRLQVKGNNIGTVSYKAHILKGKWLAEVSKWDNTANGYAGIYGSSIDGIMIKASGCKIKYRVKCKKYGWLPWVSGYNTADMNNGYAGMLGNEITAVEIKVV